MTHKNRTLAAFIGATGALTLIGLLSTSATAQSLFGGPTVPSTPSITQPAQDAATSAAGAAGAAASSAAETVTRKPARKPAPKKKVAARDASKVNIVNKRASTLVELTVTSKNAANAGPQIIASGLLAGKRKSANLARKGGCIYDVSGEFDDESTIEVAGMDLCKDSTINLVE